MKKIAIDLTSLNDNFSGIERFALEITKKLLLNKNFDFVLLFKNEIFEYFKSNKCQNCEFYICYGGKLLVNQIKIPKIIKQIKPDVVYFPAFPPSLFFRKNKKIKYISMIHDLVAWDCPGTMKLKSKYFFKIGIKHSLKISSFITSNSEFTKKRIIDKFKYKGDIVVTPPATNISLNENYSFEKAKEKYNLPEKYYLSLGTVEPRKNFDGLIEYYSSMVNETDNVLPLVIVGRKGWKVEKLLKKYYNIDDKIIFTGFVEDQYLSCIYSNAETFLFASKYEGFGLPVVESIKMGCIPVLSNISSNNEIVGKEYPLLFDLDKKSFINSMKKYHSMTNVQKESLYNDLLKKIEKYDWENSALILSNSIDTLFN